MNENSTSGDYFHKKSGYFHKNSGQFHNFGGHFHNSRVDTFIIFCDFIHRLVSNLEYSLKIKNILCFSSRMMKILITVYTHCYQQVCKRENLSVDDGTD